MSAIITKQDVIWNVARAWRKQYPSDRKTHSHDSTDATWEKLKKLPLEATEEDVARIIGNDSWTRLQCDECDNHVDAIARFDGKVDVCLGCLKNAVKELEEEVS